MVANAPARFVRTDWADVVRAGRQSTEAVRKLEPGPMARKGDASDRPRIDDRGLAKGQGTHELSGRPSFHTASTHSRK